MEKGLRFEHLSQRAVYIFSWTGDKKAKIMSVNGGPVYFMPVGSKGLGELASPRTARVVRQMHETINKSSGTVDVLTISTGSMSEKNARAWYGRVTDSLNAEQAK